MKYVLSYSIVFLLISCASETKDIPPSSKDTTTLTVKGYNEKREMKCDTMSFFNLDKYRCSKDFIFFNYIDTVSYRGINVGSGILKDGSSLQIESINDGDNRVLDIRYIKANFLDNTPNSKDSIIAYLDNEILKLCSILKFKSNIIEKVKCEIENKRGEYNSSNDTYLLTTYGDNFNEISFSVNTIPYNTIAISVLVRDVGDSDQISKCEQNKGK